MGSARYNQRRPCVIFVASRSYALTNSRTRLIKHFNNKGWRVVTIANPDQYTEKLKNLGAITEPFNVKRGGIRVLSDWITLRRLSYLYGVYNPTIVHHFHAKPLILGNIAARRHHQVKVVNTVTGLGHAFVSNKFVYYAALVGYRIALHHSAKTIFQNQANQKFFIEQNLVKPNQTCLIVSSGVNVQKYRPHDRQNSVPSDKIRILFASRLLKSKGIREFLQTAEILSTKYNTLSFQLAGEWDESHPDSIAREEIQTAAHQEIIEFLGYVDLAQQFQQTDIFVYPSFYSEGVARVLLEAAASGVPVITTNIPGCREAVQDGQTGILVEPRNVNQLVAAIEELVNSPQHRRRMGEAGRDFMVKNFDIAIITEAYLNVYRELGIEI